MVWTDATAIYVDGQEVSSLLNVRNLPNKQKIGSVSPMEEGVRLGYAKGDDGYTWALIKYWYGNIDSGKAKQGWVRNLYIDETMFE